MSGLGAAAVRANGAYIFIGRVVGSGILVVVLAIDVSRTTRLVRLGPRKLEGNPRVLLLRALFGIPQSVVADFVQPSGQHMLKKTAHEFTTAQRTGAPSRFFALFVAEGDGVLVHGDDARVGDGDAVNVSASAR